MNNKPFVIKQSIVAVLMLIFTITALVADMAYGLVCALCLAIIIAIIVLGALGKLNKTAYSICCVAIVVLVGIIVFLNFNALTNSENTRFPDESDGLEGMFTLILFGIPSIILSAVFSILDIIKCNKKEQLYGQTRNVKKVVAQPKETSVESAKVEQNSAKAKFCKYCGKEIDADAQFCKYCGKER